MEKIAIIGGGILIRLGIAYKISLQKYYKVKLFEQEQRLRFNQSTNKREVLPCGLHYMPVSLKSNLARKGIGQILKFSDDIYINYDFCGKILIANSPEEIDSLSILTNYEYSKFKIFKITK